MGRQNAPLVGLKVIFVSLVKNFVTVVKANIIIFIQYLGAKFWLLQSNNQLFIIDS